MLSLSRFAAADSSENLNPLKLLMLQLLAPLPLLRSADPLPRTGMTAGQCSNMLDISAWAYLQVLATLPLRTGAEQLPALAFAARQAADRVAGDKAALKDAEKLVAR